MQVVSKAVVKSGFRYSVENFRGIAILFVLLTHISSVDDLGTPGAYVKFFLGDATTFFVFISGYLFNYIEQRRFDYKNYMKKKIKFVILPYLILSILAIAIGLYFSRDLLMGLTPLAYGVWSLLVGGSVIPPMWFIPMICIFFILSPLFHRLGSSRLQWAVVLVALMLSIFTSRPVGNMNPLFEFVHFAGFYVLGVAMASNANQIDKIATEKIGAVIIAAALAMTVVASVLYVNSDSIEPIGFRDGFGHLNLVQFGKLMLLIALFLLFARFLNNPSKPLGWLAEISFGLFFIHGFFMVAFTWFVARIGFSDPLQKLGAELLVVIGGAMIAVMVIRRILGKWSRYVIGC